MESKILPKKVSIKFYIIVLTLFLLAIIAFVVYIIVSKVKKIGLFKPNQKPIIGDGLIFFNVEDNPTNIESNLTQEQIDQISTTLKNSALKLSQVKKDDPTTGIVNFLYGSNNTAGYGDGLGPGGAPPDGGNDNPCLQPSNPIDTQCDLNNP